MLGHSMTYYSTYTLTSKRICYIIFEWWVLLYSSFCAYNNQRLFCMRIRIFLIYYYIYTTLKLYRYKPTLVSLALDLKNKIRARTMAAAGILFIILVESIYYTVEIS